MKAISKSLINEILYHEQIICSQILKNLKDQSDLYAERYKITEQKIRHYLENTNAVQILQQALTDTRQLIQGKENTHTILLNPNERSYCNEVECGAGVVAQ